MRKLAALNHANAVALADALAQVPGVEVVTPHFFNEFTIRTPKPGAEVIEALADRGIIGGVPASGFGPAMRRSQLIVIAATEVTTPDDIADYKAALSEVLHG